MAIYFGSEATDNLATYEKGTFTPSINAGFTVTYSTQIGRYTKVGEMVYFTLYIGTSNISGSSSNTNARINGLPFNSQQLNGFNGFDISVSWIYFLGQNVNNGYVQTGQNYIELLNDPSGGNREHTNANSCWDTNSLYIMCAGWYPTSTA